MQAFRTDKEVEREAGIRSPCLNAPRRDLRKSRYRWALSRVEEAGQDQIVEWCDGRLWDIRIEALCESWQEPEAVVLLALRNVSDHFAIGDFHRWGDQNRKASEGEEARCEVQTEEFVLMLY